ncbi:hypothetical protein FPV67DRAFT_1503935 [Lyophyllum atratum]|nr:hypothetical protein FPV67DRAFT_1503935 [Lyophyllum atratum]
MRATLDAATPYLQQLVYASILGENPKENVTYPLIAEFLSQLKTSEANFTIYPQISFPWKPDVPTSTREEVPDFGIGNFDSANLPTFFIRAGAESKRAIKVMANLPEPATIEHNKDVKAAFHALYLQGEDQAKAIIKSGSSLMSTTVPFFLFVGPYWASVEYGLFNDAERTVRTHKPSASADYAESLQAKKRLHSTDHRHHHLFLLGTAASLAEMQRVIKLTDPLAETFVQASLQFTAPF